MPTGPFQRIVFALAISSSKKTDRRAADIDRLPAFGDACLGGGTRLCFSVGASGPNFLRFQRIDRQKKSYSSFLCQIDNFTGEIELVRFHPALADRNSLRLPKRVRHRAADQNGVGLFHQRLDHADLVRDFRAAQNDDERLGRLGQFLAQDI